MKAYIYQIRNKVNQKIYVGSTRQKDPKTRWYTGHINFLKRGDHNNQRLQHSFNKHGEENFVFEVLEEFECDGVTCIQEREQAYIDKLNPEYNIVRKVVRNEGLYELNSLTKGSDYIVTNTDGKETLVTNLAKFCRNNGLNTSCMGAVMRGEISNHRGWICRPADMSQTEFDAIKWKPSVVKSKSNPDGLRYELIHTDGRIILVYSLRRFATENNISHSALRNVLTGKCQYAKGWRCRYEGKEFAYQRKINIGRINKEGKPILWFLKDVFTQEVSSVQNLRHFYMTHDLFIAYRVRRLYKRGEGQRIIFSRYSDFRDVPHVPSMPSKSVMRLPSCVSMTHFRTPPPLEMRS